MEAVVNTGRIKPNVSRLSRRRKPRALILPGVYGQDLQIAALAKCCTEFADVTVLDLPPTRAPTSVLKDMVATARSIVAQIHSIDLPRMTTLIGYSFGASLALEVMVQLADTDNPIGKLAILDGPFDRPTSFSNDSSMIGVAKNVSRKVVYHFGSTTGSRRILLKMTEPTIVGNCYSDPIQKALLWHLRGKALHTWTPSRCNAEGLHVWTGSYGPTNQERWSMLCPQLRSVHVPAAHERLLAGEALEAVVQLLREMMST